MIQSYVEQLLRNEDMIIHFACHISGLQKGTYQLSLKNDVRANWSINVRKVYLPEYKSNGSHLVNKINHLYPFMNGCTKVIMGYECGGHLFSTEINVINIFSAFIRFQCGINRSTIYIFFRAKWLTYVLSVSVAGGNVLNTL